MRQQWFTHVRLLVAHLTRRCGPFPQSLPTPALDRHDTAAVWDLRLHGEPGGPTSITGTARSVLTTFYIADTFLSGRTSWPYPYQGRPGCLSEDQYADALATADVVTHAVLALQADAPPGVLAAALERVGADRAEVYQASGMVAARLGVGVGEALVRLRAHAYAEARPLVEIARDVVARRLRLG